jgi:uncharacterized membrane protein
MTQALISGANILHTLGTIVFIGFFSTMAVILLPILSKNGSVGMQALSEISKRSRWWLYGAMAVLASTGVYLTFVDGNYAGIGNFNTTWAVLMLAKHIVILTIIVLGFWFNAIKRVGPAMLSTSNAAAGLLRFKRYCSWMSACGILVLFLTGIGQVL